MDKQLLKDTINTILKYPSYMGKYNYYTCNILLSDITREQDVQDWLKQQGIIFCKKHNVVYVLDFITEIVLQDTSLIPDSQIRIQLRTEWLNQLLISLE